MDRNYKIAYCLSDLKMVGPTNQTFNIIKHSKYKDNSLVITLFDEPNDSIKSKFLEENIKIECLHLNRKLYFLKLDIFVDVLKQYKIQLIHSYGIKADYISQKASDRLNIMHIITLRNYPKEDILMRMNFIKGNIALRNHLKTLLKCPNVVCCSKSIKRKMEQDYPWKPFLCVQNGVDLDKFQSLKLFQKDELRKKYMFRNEDKIFICTNSFIPRKRIEETIKLFINIPERNKRLVLLGDGMLFKKINEKYKDYKDILFVGKTDKIVEYLNISDYFISSSASEGLPNAVLEAISCGVPVILSDISQHMEIFYELDIIGLSYPLGNPEIINQLYKKINSKDYTRFLENTTKIKESVFSMKYMSESYVKLYEEIGGLNV